MFDTLKARWRAFIAVPRGERFLAHHRRAHRDGAAGWVRYAVMAGASLMIVVGIAMLVLPGPGLLVMLAGAVLLAEESAFVARVMDRIDLAVARAGRRWRRGLRAEG
ncbi:PGPGW domain-containing protein [Dokdonella fugitiva]|jgi:hypothetical protein|uniref:Putative transmembrane protein PGPGW n=1 Tax=Dokdonella fugitiva TaxID=328517 RepID=A0A4R2HU55_9GAMM|nr:PGPGW domain-containing protein [Dokdonella fugitiva]MBA8885327.1 hypothetical protein [Dokdonella fugitiva]TCO34941.1 putative transmembrane protein PGPGW [Dokdonella fugitiva]